MKTFVIFVTSFFLFVATAQARNDLKDYPIADVMSSDKAKNLLGSNIRFYFGSQKHGRVKQRLGNYKTNKKTNAFNKSDVKACNHVFLSALIQLRDRAVAEGGNAVINIKSNYKNNLTSSNSTFKCGVGNVIAGVALTGDVVKID